jgi:hypothetical protein
VLASSRWIASLLFRTPVWCEYRPVKIVAREGQHRGVFRKALGKVIQ